MRQLSRTKLRMGQAEGSQGGGPSRRCQPRLAEVRRPCRLAALEPSGERLADRRPSSDGGLSLLLSRCPSSRSRSILDTALLALMCFGFHFSLSQALGTFKINTRNCTRTSVTQKFRGFVELTALFPTVDATSCRTLASLQNSLHYFQRWKLWNNYVFCFLRQNKKTWQCFQSSFNLFTEGVLLFISVCHR